MTNTVKPASTAQLNRINALIEKGIIARPQQPITASWEASAIIRTAAASKRDKEELKSSGGRVLARMTTGEVEMTSKVVEFLKTFDMAGVKNTKVLEAAQELRKMFGAKAH